MCLFPKGSLVQTVATTIWSILCVVEIVFFVILLVFVALVDDKSDEAHSRLSELNAAATSLPYKYAPRFDQPHTTQGDRGTCWAHGIVAGLAHSYKRNGVLKGFLKPNEYVPFSVQAFAIRMIKVCQQDKYKDTVCKGLQYGPERNSTSNGEVAWLYYMPEVWKQLFPLSLCPYIDDDEDDHEWVCPHLDDEIARDDNPIRFTIRSMSAAYTASEMKKLVYESGLAAPYSVDVWVNTYFIPCPASGAANESYSTICNDADITAREACPASVTKVADTDRCIRYLQPGYNLDGEFYQTTPYEMEGGHCMLIQGYNDEYVSRYGDKGGFPIKNSWYDKAYPFKLPKFSRGGRGSHSLQYLMSEISEQEERMICPNAQNPDNWLSCTEYSTQTDPSTPNISFCLDTEKMNAEVKWERRPMRFNNTAKLDDDTPMDDNYYMDTLTHLPNRMATIRLIHTHDDGSFDKFVTIRDVPIGYIAERFQPIEEQANWLQNDFDNCGLYWMPYAVNQNTARDNEAWHGEIFDIVWDDSSYLVNRDRYPQYNYKYLNDSQTVRNTWGFDGPIARARPAPTNPDVDQ